MLKSSLDQMESKMDKPSGESEAPIYQVCPLKMKNITSKNLNNIVFSYVLLSTPTSAKGRTFTDTETKGISKCFMVGNWHTFIPTRPNVWWPPITR